MRTAPTIFSLSLLALLSAGVFSNMAVAEDKPRAEAAPAAEKTAQVPEETALQGKVLETMNAGGYTYLHLDSQRGKVWVAIPETRVEVGEEVSSAPGMVMRNFTSKTLGRSFESIVFSPGLGAVLSGTPAAPAQRQNDGDSFSQALEAEARASGRPHAAGSATMAQGNSVGSAGAIVPSAAIKVDKAPGSDSYSVGEIFTQARQLDGRKVRVRGKVMKNSRMIMDRNWLHLQDGTGDPDKQQHDLVVTTTDDAAEGDIITVWGTVAADRDFGSGYSYQVLIENATVEKK